jgi:hypothetical protein
MLTGSETVTVRKVPANGVIPEQIVARLDGKQEDGNESHKKCHREDYDEVAEQSSSL